MLHSTASELFDLAEVGERLHDIVERHLMSAGAHEGAIVDAQLIDFLVQHLESVGAFLRLLADQTPRGLHIDFDRVRGRLPLADLERRLSGDMVAQHGVGASHAAGDLDLF